MNTAIVVFNTATEILRIKLAFLIGKLPVFGCRKALVWKLKAMAFLGDIEN